jgi:hypothetical protein
MSDMYKKYSRFEMKNDLFRSKKFEYKFVLEYSIISTTSVPSESAFMETGNLQKKKIIP